MKLVFIVRIWARRLKMLLTLLKKMGKRGFANVVVRFAILRRKRPLWNRCELLLRELEAEAEFFLSRETGESMKNTSVSRFCSVAFVQKRQTGHYTQYSSTYLSVYRLDALPSLADLARIIPSRLLLRPGQPFFSDAAEPRDFFFFPSTPVELSKTDQYPPPLPSDNPMASYSIPQSFILHGTFCLCIHGSLSLQQILFFLLRNTL